MRLVVENRKLLPLAWLRARSAIPPALTPEANARRWPSLERDGFLEAVAALGWHSRASWEFDLPCRARGVFEIGPVELTSGDPFGFRARRMVVQDRATIVVYPRVVPLRRLGFPLAAGFGFSQRQRSYQEDSARTAGVREYRPGDPLRRVHWKATARQGELQVKVLEPAVAPLLILVLASDSFDFPWSRYREDLFELAVSALASIAWRALEDGWPVGLLANSGSAVKIPPSSSPRQLGMILEELAAVQPVARLPIAQLMAEQAEGLRSATYVFAVGRATERVHEVLGQLHAARQPAVLLYGDEPLKTGPLIPSYRLRQWDDLATTLEGNG